MARTKTDPRSIMHRSSRLKLDERREPYWHPIGAGQHVGYRKGSRGGTWIARYYRPGVRGRFYENLGRADDTVQADGEQILSFTHAVQAAQKFMSKASRADKADIRIGRYTVNDAAEDWLSVFSGSASSKETSAGNIRRYIMPALGDLAIDKLTRKQIENWLHSMANKPTMRSLAAKSKVAYDIGDPEMQRRRRESANRILNDLKALLNTAYKNQHASSKAAWETVTPIPNTSRARKETLDIEEAFRLLDACESDFTRMVRAALVTGCRWGEICKLRVQDFDSRAKLLTVLQDKTGKVKHISLTDEDADFFSENAQGRAQMDLLFLRADGKPWGKGDQRPRMEAAVSAARTKERVTFHGLRHTVGRWLAEQNLPMAIIAKHLGHSNSRVTEQFYAHYSPSHVQDTIRASKPSLKLVKSTPKTQAS